MFRHFCVVMLVLSAALACRKSFAESHGNSTAAASFSGAQQVDFPLQSGFEPQSISITGVRAIGGVSFTLPPALNGLNFSVSGIGTTTAAITFSGIANASGLVTVPVVVNVTEPAASVTLYMLLYVQNPYNHNTPRFISGPTVSPQAVVLGTGMFFSAAAEDLDGDQLSYFWDFGDGHTSREQYPPVFHYHSEGYYTVSCTVSDGKRMQGKVFQVAQSKSTAGLTFTKANLFFDFRKPEQSSFVIQGRMIVPEPLAPVTASATVTIAQPAAFETRSFTLSQPDSKSFMGGDTKTQLILKKLRTGGTNPHTGAPIPSIANFILTLKGEPSLPLFNELQGLGFIRRGKASVEVPLALTVPGGVEQSGTLTLKYNAVLNKTGKGK